MWASSPQGRFWALTLPLLYNSGDPEVVGNMAMATSRGGHTVGLSHPGTSWHFSRCQQGPCYSEPCRGLRVSAIWTWGCTRCVAGARKC